MQEIIVYLILACVAILLIYYTYRFITGKSHSCNCGSCPMHKDDEVCHCHDHE